MMAVKIHIPPNGFGMIAHQMAQDRELSRNAKSVYLEMYSTADLNRHSKEPIKITIQYLATLSRPPYNGKDASAGLLTVRKAIKELVDRGWVKVVKPERNRRGVESDYELFYELQNSTIETKVEPKVETTSKTVFENSPLFGALSVMNCQTHFQNKYPDADYQWYIDTLVRWLKNNPDYRCIDWFSFLENKIAADGNKYKRLPMKQPVKDKIKEKIEPQSPSIVQNFADFKIKK